MSNDAASQAVWLPLESGRITLPDRAPAVFLNARGAPPRLGGLSCVQSFKPDNDALSAQGFATLSDSSAFADASQSLVMLLPPRSRQWARAQMAEAARLCAADGQVVVSAANDEGAKSVEADFRRLFGDFTTLSKHKCRVVWAGPAAVDAAVLAEWKDLGDPFQRGDGLWSQAGVFSADAIDPASALLLANLPQNLRGRVADLGAGIGVLAHEVSRHYPAVSRIDLFEADARALEMARRNLADASIETAFHWHDVTTGIDGRFDAIVMNPPFHATGKRGMPELGQRFIDVAANALARTGELWMVANSHLPYEEALARRFSDVQALATAKGFKVIRASGVKS